MIESTDEREAFTAALEEVKERLRPFVLRVPANEHERQREAIVMHVNGLRYKDLL
jgi:hypothetical protein